MGSGQEPTLRLGRRVPKAVVAFEAMGADQVRHELASGVYGPPTAPKALLAAAWLDAKDATLPQSGWSVGYTIAAVIAVGAATIVLTVVVVL